MKVLGVVRDVIIFVIMVSISAQSLTADSIAGNVTEMQGAQSNVEPVEYEFDVDFQYYYEEPLEQGLEVSVLSYQENDILNDSSAIQELASLGINEKDLEFTEFISTAYDLTETCCGKPRDHPEFGLTAGGYDLEGLSRNEARIVAVDPKIIPLHSKLYITFEAPYEEYTGVYTAGDTGSAIVGNIIDLFYGDFGTQYSVQETKEFGRREVKVAVLD